MVRETTFFASFSEQIQDLRESGAPLPLTRSFARPISAFASIHLARHPAPPQPGDGRLTM